MIKTIQQTIHLNKVHASVAAILGYTFLQLIPNRMSEILPSFTWR